MEARPDMTQSHILPKELFASTSCVQGAFCPSDWTNHVPSLYVPAQNAGWKTIAGVDEITDQEILRAVEQSGSFDFLADPKENVYAPEDGEPA